MILCKALDTGFRRKAPMDGHSKESSILAELHGLVPNVLSTHQSYYTTDSPRRKTLASKQKQIGWKCYPKVVFTMRHTTLPT